MLPLIVTLSLVAVIAIAIGISYFRNKQDRSSNILAAARERAEQRKLDRAFMNTTPIEDPYDRSYDLHLAMSATEVDESAIGYGTLDDEQKRVIAAIFDNHAAAPSSLTTAKTGIVQGSRWSQSVFGELNQIDPIADKDIWSTSRN